MTGRFCPLFWPWMEQKRVVESKKEEGGQQKSFTESTQQKRISETLDLKNVCEQHGFAREEKIINT